MFLKVDIKSVCIEENALKICEIKTPLNIEICDLIGCRLCEEPPSFLSSLFGSSPYLSIRYISKGENYRWTAETVQVTGSKEECGALENRINDKIGQEKNRPKKLGVFINPIGGNQSSLSIYSSVISPLFKEANISCDVLVTERSKHMIDLANSFDTTSVDGLVVMGGDGTLLEVFNTLLTRVQKEANLDYDQPTCKLKPLEIPIGIIPTGTGNGVAKGLYGNIDVVTAALHIIRGRTRYNNVQALYTGGKLASFSSVIVAVGLFSEMMFHTERQRWMKKARYVFVPLHLLLFKKQRLFNAKLTIYHKNRNSLDGAEPTEWEDAVQLEGKKIESKCFSIASPGAGLNYACAPFGASVMQYIKHPSEFVVVTYRACGRLEILSHFLNAAQEKLDAGCGEWCPFQGITHKQEMERETMSLCSETAPKTRTSPCWSTQRQADYHS
ncbi:ceramide kinase-like isoform X3 [Crassostrea virginica]|uniref:Ceramide kinase-like isoform X3 n=1 Tax=Crassostrea virginica TaxID=6565 RepID=A0A8B8E9W0_CRAVI|nr:ceramide kinase-like isoform X3 [Crassostrea virginica]